MKITTPIEPTPTPVLPSKVDIEYKYVVVRGDGKMRFFESLYGGGDGCWYDRGYSPASFSNTIYVPMDMVTALMLKLIQPHELELPEHLKAFVNMIKP